MRTAARWEMTLTNEDHVALSELLRAAFPAQAQEFSGRSTAGHSKAEASDLFERAEVVTEQELLVNVLPLGSESQVAGRMTHLRGWPQSQTSIQQ